MAHSGKPNHILAFAEAHRSSIFPTFNAYAALVRAESLREDVEYLAKIHGTRAKVDDLRRWSGLEITDYYAAGYVTCLEWHARSRRADLLTFMPQLIRPGMMTSIDTDAISQMSRAKVTLADLIGASTKVNSLKAYTDVFDQIWEALKIKTPLASIVEASKKLAGQDRLLYELFERRHILVHEIGITQIGSYLQRDTWTFQQASDHGRMVVGLIKGIESLISEFASDEFPNKLDRGYPQDRQSVLERKIADVEARIARVMDPSGNDEFSNAQRLSSKYLKAQMDFVGAALIDVPKRYYDPTPGLVEMLYRQRLEFLTAIAKEIEA
jgi:hypothetical protein